MSSNNDALARVGRAAMKCADAEGRIFRRTYRGTAEVMRPSQMEALEDAVKAARRSLRRTRKGGKNGL